MTPLLSSIIHSLKYTKSSDHNCINSVIGVVVGPTKMAVERIALDMSRNRHISDTSHHLVHMADVQHHGAPSCLKVHQPSGKLVADFIDWNSKGAKLASYDPRTGLKVGEGRIMGNRSTKSEGMVALNSKLDCVAFASGADTREKITLQFIDTLRPRSAAWAMPKDRIIKGLGSRINHIAFSPLDNFLVCRTTDRYTRYILDISRDRCTDAVSDGIFILFHSKNPEHANYRVSECVFSPDERFFAATVTYTVRGVTKSDVTERLVKSAIHVYEIKKTCSGLYMAPQFLFELADPCTPIFKDVTSMLDATSFSWRPDGRCFAYVMKTGIEMCTLCSDDGKVFDAPVRKTLFDYIKVEEARCDFFPNAYNMFKEWEIPSCLKGLSLCKVESICWSPDNVHLAYMNGTWNTMCVVDTRTRKQLFTFPCYQCSYDLPLSIIWSPNGGQVTSLGLDDPSPGHYCPKVRTWAAREWSDRTHYLFGPELRRMVFQLICVRDRLIKERDATGTSIVPHLPMSLWLDIFLFLSLTQNTIPHPRS